MLQRIRLQTPDGIREYKVVSDSIAYDAAKEAGEIEIGEDIVYRSFFVHILPGYQMLILDRVSMGGANWSFTVNGEPVTPEQMAEFMEGGPA